MVDSRFSFTVEVRRGGSVLGTAPAGVAACVEDAFFRGVLTGRLPNDGTVPRFTISPVWGEAGPPAIAGLTVAHAGAPAGTYGLDVFAAKARAVITDLVRNQVLKDEDRVEWGVIASEQPPAPPPRFRARASRTPYPFRPGHLADAAPESFAVAIDGGVLDAIRQAVVAGPTTECAGLLVGHLVHDRARGAAALTVTGQIPVAAGRGGASNLHFAFGPDSFLVARQTLDRSANETCVAGWWHSHPPCEQCPKNPECTADTVFFSADDAQVHASAFPAAYMVGVVAGKVRDRHALDPGFRLYVWKNGGIAERPLQVGGPGSGINQETAVSGRDLGTSRASGDG